MIGDLQPGNATHDAIAPAVAHADAARGPTTAGPSSSGSAPSEARDLPLAALDRHAGFWIAPGSPYRSMDGALRVIRYAREADRPLLGTCAGFQHLVIELARDVLGIADAAHAENDPDATNLFVTLLSCSLVGQSMTVSLRPGTRAAALYPAAVGDRALLLPVRPRPGPGRRPGGGRRGRVGRRPGRRAARSSSCPAAASRWPRCSSRRPRAPPAPPHPVVAGFVEAIHAAPVPTIGRGGTHERGQR